jgi:4-hydroxybenzoate polyprenyltransferase
MRWPLRAMMLASGLVVAWALLRPGLPRATRVVAVALSFAVVTYQWLRRVPLAKTVAVATCWGVACSLLPVAAPRRPEALPWLAACIAGLLASNCLPCDLKDVALDRAAGVRSAPVLFGQRASLAAAITLATLASALALLRDAWPLALGGAALVALALRPALAARELLGPLLADAALVLPGVATLSGA